MVTAVFAAAALVEGALGLADPFFPITVVTALGAWTWWRQSALEGLSFRQRIVKGLIAYAIIGFMLLVPFELGQFLGGHK